MAIDTIFFDVDGTLVDSRKDIVEAVDYTLRQLGLPIRPAKEIVSYIGTGVRDLVSKSIKKRKADPLVEKGVVRQTNKGSLPRVKLLKGELKRKLTVRVTVSTSAREAIVKAGGTVK